VVDYYYFAFHPLEKNIFLDQELVKKKGKKRRVKKEVAADRASGMLIPS